MPWTFAVVGCGSIGKRHLRNLKTLGQETLIGIDPREDRRLEVQALGVKTAATILEAHGMGANVCLITSPSALHAAHMRESLDAGCHLFVEKPLATSSSEVAQLVAQAAREKRVGFMGSNFKFHPSFQQMKLLMEQEAIGRVLHARVTCGQYLPDWHPWEDYRQGYSAQKKLGGGVLLDSHELSYIPWLLGPVAAVACRAERLSDLEIDTEDTVSMILKMQSGAQVELHLDYTSRFPQRSYEIHGTKGMIRWDIHHRQVELFAAQEKQWTRWPEPEQYQINDMYVAQMRHFMECLTGLQAPLTPLSEGLETLHLIELSHQAAQEQRFLEVRPIASSEP